MKILSLILGIATALFFTQTASAAKYTLNCFLSMPIKRAEGGQYLYRCVERTSQGQKIYGVGFTNVAFDIQFAIKNGSGLQVKFDFTSSPDGTYLYGGETIGFETANSKRLKWFYAVSRGGLGRAYISADPALFGTFKAATNESAIVIVPIK